LLIVTPNYKSIWIIVEKVLDRFSLTPNMGNHQHLSKYSIDKLEKIIKLNKMKIIKS